MTAFAAHNDAYRDRQNAELERAMVNAMVQCMKAEEQARISGAFPDEVAVCIYVTSLWPAEVEGGLR